jgi:hypothetical protein
MERGLGGEDCGHSVGAVHRCLDVSDTRSAMDKPGHEICTQKKMDVSSLMDDETRLRARSLEIEHWHARTMSSEFVSKCQRADGNRGLNQ